MSSHDMLCVDQAFHAPTAHHWLPRRGEAGCHHDRDDVLLLSCWADRNPALLCLKSSAGPGFTSSFTMVLGIATGCFMGTLPLLLFVLMKVIWTDVRRVRRLWVEGNTHHLMLLVPTPRQRLFALLALSHDVISVCRWLIWAPLALHSQAMTHPLKS